MTGRKTRKVPLTRERRRLLENWLTEGLTPKEQTKIPPNLLESFRKEIQAKVKEGIDAIDRGDAVDGEEFFAKWRERLKAASRRPTATNAPFKQRRRRLD